LLTESATNGAAVFIATHDVELVAELASRIIILAEGELVADGNAYALDDHGVAFGAPVNQDGTVDW